MNSTSPQDLQGAFFAKRNKKRDCKTPNNKFGARRKTEIGRK